MACNRYLVPAVGSLEYYIDDITSNSDLICLCVYRMIFLSRWSKCPDGGGEGRRGGSEPSVTRLGRYCYFLLLFGVFNRYAVPAVGSLEYYIEFITQQGDWICVVCL